jgi:hypothetical protein
MYTYYPVPGEVKVNKGKGTRENDKLFILEDVDRYVYGSPGS